MTSCQSTEACIHALQLCNFIPALTYLLYVYFPRAKAPSWPVKALFASLLEQAHLGRCAERLCHRHRMRLPCAAALLTCTRENGPRPQTRAMFGGAQEDAVRAARLRRVQEDHQAQDEHADGQEGNVMLTLVGTLQEDASRAARLRRVQEDYQAQDEHADGQEGNMMLALQRGELGRRKAASAGAAAAAARDKDRAERQDADAEAAVRPPNPV